MKAIGMFIFAGSASIGVRNAGFEIDRVLEISDEMLEQNAAHFIHNYPEILVENRTTWRLPGYLEETGRVNDYDLMYGNPPCSGLSQINRNAKADNDVNKYIYEYVDAVLRIKPKAFIMENAPTLLTTGKPIVDDIVNQLKDNYCITIIRDCARNHRVAMLRRRTMIIGWRKDIFKSAQLLTAEKAIIRSIEAISGDYSLNTNLVPERTNKDLDWIIKDLPHNISENYFLATHYEEYKDRLTESQSKTIKALHDKLENGGRIFDKSPYRFDGNGLAPSLASVVELIHPTENRPLYVREYARLMGYPEGFEFIETKTPIIQCIAQGVPAPFMEWAAECVRHNLETPHQIEDITYDVIYQNLSSGKPNYTVIEDIETFSFK